MKDRPLIQWWKIIDRFDGVNKLNILIMAANLFCLLEQIEYYIILELIFQIITYRRREVFEIVT